VAYVFNFIVLDQNYIWTDLNGNGFPETVEFQVFNLSYYVNWTHSWAFQIDVNGTIWTV
jgi:hypothetical protein